MVPLIQFSASRVLAAVVAAGFAAVVFVHVDSASMPVAARAGIAGEAVMQMLSDEHAIIAGYLKDEAEARTLVDRSAARDMERMKVAALDEAQPSGLRLAQTEPASSKVKAGLKIATVRSIKKPEPVQVANGVTPAGAPMQLFAMTGADMQTAPPPTRAGMVRVKLRQLASTVVRIPSWVNSAAEWMVDTVPVPRMPMRHFGV